MKISFVVPVMDETISLREVVDTIQQVAGEKIEEVLVVVSVNTTKDSRAEIERLQQKYGERLRVYQQVKPGLGGAMSEAFGEARGDYVMLMASDLETDPKAIPLFVKRMEKGDVDIVVGSRWLQGGGFEGYGGIKVAMNWVFQKLVGLLYGARLTDLTYAYRLYRKEVLVGIKWEELKHAFLLECLLKPLKRRARVAEVPCQWRVRTEGESHGAFGRGWKYLWLAVKLRFHK